MRLRIAKCAFRAGLLIVAVWSGLAAAEPAHYVVFELDAEGAATPVFHSRVELAVDRGENPDLGRPSSTENEVIQYRAVLEGKPGASRQVIVPRFLRAEFAKDADTGTGEIEHHPNVEDTARAFVVRIAVAEADHIELHTDSGPQQFDLVALERDAANLPLASVAPVTTVLRTTGDGDSATASNSANRVDILVLGDGYTSAEQSTFNTHSEALRTQMFNVTPYREYASFINWQTGFVVSTESGADHPPYQAGCSTNSCCADSTASGDPRAGTFVNTALDAKFCTNQIHRLLTVNSSKVLAAASGYPNWDQILVTVNDPVYGGAGGNFGVTSANTNAPLIVIHEYAHSFHKLADEYESAYPGFPACSDISGNQRCEANVTNQTNPNLVKWRSWFTPGIQIPTPAGTAGLGLFEGARYLSNGIYRPVHNTCLMRSLGLNFCHVCRQEYVKHLYRGGFNSPVAGIDLIEPGSESPSPSTPVAVQVGVPREFHADILRPSSGSVSVQWYFDGEPIPNATHETLSFVPPSTGATTRQLELRVIDDTDFVRAEMADGLLVHQRVWTLNLITDRLFANGFDG
jgi:hypothetical protein